MRLVLSQEGWVFDGLTGLEWLFLQRLPILVDELVDDGDARLRLFPDPVRGVEEEAREGSGTDGDEAGGEINSDWKEYVRPELETLFDEARRVVAVDLGGVRRFEDTGGEGGEGLDGQVYYSLEVSGEHVEQWNSTLNQARLLMNEVYDLAETERKLAEGLMELTVGDGEPGGKGGQSRQAGAYPQWLLLAQYGFYGALQSYLIEYVMDV
jgi:hypothetical protein